MDIMTEINSFHNYAESIRNQPEPMVVERGINLEEFDLETGEPNVSTISLPSGNIATVQAVSISEIDEVWNIIKAGASFLERFDMCCNCSLGQRVVNKLNELDTLKEQVCELLLNLHAELRDNGDISSDISLLELQENILARIELIRQTPFPQKFTEIMNTYQDIRDAVESLDGFDQIKAQLHELATLNKTIAKAMHIIDIFGSMIS